MYATEMLSLSVLHMNAREGEGRGVGSENGCCVALTLYYTYFEVARQAYLVERPGTVAPSNVRLDPQVDEFERSHLEPAWAMR